MYIIAHVITCHQAKCPCCFIALIFSLCWAFLQHSTFSVSMPLSFLERCCKLGLEARNPLSVLCLAEIFQGSGQQEVEQKYAFGESAESESSCPTYWSQNLGQAAHPFYVLIFSSIKWESTQLPPSGSAWVHKPRNICLRWLCLRCLVQCLACGRSSVCSYWRKEGKSHWMASSHPISTTVAAVAAVLYS